MIRITLIALTPPLSLAGEGEQTASRPSAIDWTWLFFCIALSSAWCLSVGAELGATFDEPLYLARGLEAWRSGSHAGLLQLGTMPLPADLQTLPLYLAERWRGVPIDLASELPTLLPVARAATLLFWAILLFYGWRVGTLLAGRWGGALAAALLASEPSLLAHAALATTDVALAACLLALAHHFRAGRSSAWWGRIGVPAVWFAIALLAKASALVMGTLCLLVSEAARRRGGVSTSEPWSRAFRDVATIAAIGLGLAFVFCGSDWLPQKSFVAWARSLPDGAPLRDPIVWLAEHLRIFSNAGEALVRQVRHNLRGHGTFLLGSTHPRALWYYFPVLLTIKLSEPLLLGPPLLALAWRRALANWPLLLAAALLLASLTFRVQIGVRMVLPIVAFAAVGLAVGLADAIDAWRGTWRARLLAGGALAALLWNVQVAWSLWPDALVHVNRFCGGASEGYRLVSDSNYDWGQGIPELQRWQRARGGAELAVWYFGTDPRAAQPPLRVVPLHRLPIARPEDVAAAVGDRLLAVSTTLLSGSDAYRDRPEGESYRHALEALRGRQPVARTGTFLIYDLGDPSPRTNTDDHGPAAGPQC